MIGVGNHRAVIRNQQWRLRECNDNEFVPACPWRRPIPHHPQKTAPPFAQYIPCPTTDDRDVPRRMISHRNPDRPIRFVSRVENTWDHCGLRRFAGHRVAARHHKAYRDLPAADRAAAGDRVIAGDTLAPLALVSVGLQPRLDQLSGSRAPLVLGLGFKLAVGPLLIALVYFSALSWEGETSPVTVFRITVSPEAAAIVPDERYPSRNRSGSGPLRHA
jgi:hypothetical protein